MELVKPIKQPEDMKKKDLEPTITIGGKLINKGKILINDDIPIKTDKKTKAHINKLLKDAEN